MSKFASFGAGQIESLAKVLGDCGTGSAITRVLNERGLEDHSGESTKWRRLQWVFLRVQKRDKCANRVIDFIQGLMSPSRFVGDSEKFADHREKLNAILAFSGLVFGPDGEFRKREPARTLSEAELHLKSIHNKLKGRHLHPEVLKYCTTELMQENYFHAVFEATKGLAQRIRDKSDVEEDGAELVNRVFSIEKPMLALNSLQTLTEKSEHKGFAALLKGCFGAIRNPLAHGPKILWEGEDDAADYLSLISLLHRKLDQCVPTRFGDSR